MACGLKRKKETGTKAPEKKLIKGRQVDGKGQIGLSCVCLPLFQIVLDQAEHWEECL